VLAGETEAMTRTFSHEFWRHNGIAPFVSRHDGGLIRAYVSEEAREAADKRWVAEFDRLNPKTT
jgi:hypothetical protein